MSSRIKLINGCVTRLFGAFMTLDLMLRADFVQKVNAEEFIALQQEDETRRVPKFVIGLIYQAKDPSARMESTRFLIHDIGTIGYARLACGLDALVTVHHEHYEPLTPVRLTFGIPERDKQLLRGKKIRNISRVLCMSQQTVKNMDHVSNCIFKAEAHETGPNTLL